MTNFVANMSRIDKETKIVGLMVRLYCRRKEGNRELCPECAELIDYAGARLHHCPFGERKSSCRKCTIHCYRPEMRKRIRRVMRYSGPRMLLYHPLEYLRHLL